MAKKKVQLDATQPFGSPKPSPSQVEHSQEGIELGSLLDGRYLIERELARGGIGVVYLGRDQQVLSRPVVIKVLLEESNQNEWFKKKFRQEIEALARIDHPSVVGVIDAGEMPDGKLYLVMQFVQGTNLRSAIRDEGMDFKRVASIVRHMGQAVSAAHDKGVVHRDLKPENIMLQNLGGGEEQIKLIDFGIAAIRDSQVVATNRDTGTIAGTMAYMAPEQLQGKPSPSSDIYSMAVIAYEMLTGRRPFHPESPFELLELQRAGPTTKPSSIRKDLPEVADGVILKALSFHPDKRHNRARDFGDELERVLTVNIAEQEKRADPDADTIVNSKTDMRLHKLPEQSSALIGREKEVDSVKTLLHDKDVRLLTLTGTGGSGKTRLALRVAQELITELEGGVYFVSLAAISDPGLVTLEIAHTLGIRETGENSLMEDIKERLRNRKALLLLDNFEQVVPAAPFLTEVLAACPKLKILVTSRAGLHLRMEREFEVPPLALPPLHELPAVEALSQYPAVALFMQRARAAKPQFELNDENARTVAEISVRLDGLPLAIELAAAKIKFLSAKAILSRLGDRFKLLTGGPQDLPTRQQTMLDTIAWSYDLLQENEKMLFRQLTVFVGGFTLEMAEVLLYDKVDVQPSVLDGVASLVDKSMLRSEERNGGERRLLMLETIREYGLECLKTSGEVDATRRRHAQLFLDLAESAASELKGPQQSIWLDRLEEEQDNLRAALRWLKESGNVEIALRIAASPWRFWEVRGHLREGRWWLEELLKMPRGKNVSTSVRAKALYAAGILAHDQSNYDQAVALLEEGLTLYRDLDDKHGIAAALSTLALAAHNQSDYRRATILIEEALAQYQQLEDKQGVASALSILGIVALHRGDYQKAVLLQDQSVALRRDLGDVLGTAASLTIAGVVALDYGDYERASILLEESLTLYRDLKDKMGMAASLNNLGEISLFRGDYEAAARSFEKSLDVFREIGDKRDVAAVLNNMGHVARFQADYREATTRYSESLALAYHVGEKSSMASSFEGLAALAGAQSQPERAARLFGVAEALRQTVGAPLPRTLRDDYDRNIDYLRARLAQNALGEIWAEGRAMTLEQAIAFALDQAAVIVMDFDKPYE